MADNKRKKEDFSTSLKKASEKLKPRDLRKDSVTILIGGVPTEIVRHDMDDEAWGNVVRQSIKEATPAESKQPFPDRQDQKEAVSVQGDDIPGITPESSEAEDRAKQEEWKAASQVKDIRKKSIDWPQLMAIGQNLNFVDKSIVSDEEKGHLKGMSEWSRAEFLRERFKKRGYEVPQTTAEAERESFQKPAVAEEVPSEKPAPPKSGTVTEDDVQVGSNTPSIRNPASFIPQMALGATGDRPPGNPMLNAFQEKVAPMEGGFPGASNPAPVEGGFPGLAGGDAGVAQADAKGAQHGAEDAAWLKSQLAGPPVDQMPPSHPATWPSQVRNTINEVRRLYGPQPEAPDGPPLPGQPIPSTRNPDGTAKTTQSPPPSPVAAPPPGVGDSPTSEAMKLSLSGGGGFTPAQVDPKAKALQQQAQADAIQAQKDAQQRIEAEANNQKTITDKAAEIELNERQKADMLGALATEAQLEATRKAESWSNARASAAAAARDAAANPIDPNRYWNNKSDGQKAMAVIAGALYGFTGQGMQWLQRIDSLVEADNRLQASDRASKVEGLKSYAAEMGAQAEDAMRFGLSRAQAHLLARTQKLEGLKSQLDILAMRQTDSMRAQQAAQMSAVLAQHIDQIANQGLSLAQQEAQMKSADRYHQAQLAMQRMELAVKAAKAAEGGGEQLRGPQVQNISDLMNALRTAENMSASFKDKASGFLSKIAALDPTGSTDASQFNARRDVAVQLIGRALEGGKLAEGDIGRYQAMIPKAGDLRGEERWDQLITELQQRLANDVTSFANAGFDVGALPRQAAGLLAPKGPPSYAKPR